MFAAAAGLVARSIEGRTAIPFVLNTMSDELQWNWSMVAMGFVGKNIECADELLREGDRDPTERGQKMRQTGVQMVQQNAAHLFDVDVIHLRLQRVPRPPPGVSCHVSERFVLPEAKTHLVAVRDARSDRVIAPNRTDCRGRSAAARVSRGGTGKPEVEPDGPSSGCRAPSAPN